MKKLMAILLSAMMIATLTACGSEEPTASEEQETPVVSETSEQPKAEVKEEAKEEVKEPAQTEPAKEEAVPVTEAAEEIVAPLVTFADNPLVEDFEFPTPKAPNYFIYTDGDAAEGHDDDLRMFMTVDPEVALLAAEYYEESSTFYEKNGLYYFNICMQYDVSLDGEENWQYTSEWDTDYNQGSYGEGFQSVTLGGEAMEDFEFFWLTYHEGQGSDTFVPYQPALIMEQFNGDGYEEEVYSFDVENHSLYIRCRYYMEWEPYDAEKNEIGERQSRFSEWSESAVFGKDSTKLTPETPTTYEAPIIFDLKIVTEEGYDGYLEYIQITPEANWLAQVYYMMTGDGQYEGLETQVSIENGEWIDIETADAGDDWCLYNGGRTGFNGGELALEEDTHVKLRVRFIGSHGPSEWSNIIEINGAEPE